MTRPAKPRTLGIPGVVSTSSLQNSIIRVGTCGLGGASQKAMGFVRFQEAQPPTVQTNRVIAYKYRIFLA